MKLTPNLQQKLAYMARLGISPGGLRLRDDPIPKIPQTLYLATFNLRTDSVRGGAVPDDELQLDFVISSAKRDGHFSYMTEKTLENYGADATAGCPFMLDHGTDMRSQIGRVVSGTYNAEAKQVVATIQMLRDTDATPENLRVNEYIRRIEKGYYGACSVGFRDGQEICRLDQKPIWDFAREDHCPHTPGVTYPEGICEYDVDDAHLREVSLVPTGSNTDAGAVRSTWSEEMRKAKPDVVGAPGVPVPVKSILELDGEKYRANLITLALAEGVRAYGNEFKEAEWKPRFDKNDADFIIAQTQTFKDVGDAKWGPGGRVTGPADQPDEDVVLYYPENLFRI